MKRIASVMIGLVANFALAAPTILSVNAEQRSNGDAVDVYVKFSGTAVEIAKVECSFAATNVATKVALSTSHIAIEGEDSGMCTNWTRHFVWDIKSDVGEVKIDEVELTVSGLEPLGGVQLWKGGPYWAECNVGATKQEEYGYYFWWGDTVGYKRVGSRWNAVDGSRTGFSFSSGNCPTYGKSNSQLQSAGYIDSTGCLAVQYDAASAYLGLPWRMPTATELSALVNHCNRSWTVKNGVKGYLFKGDGAYSDKSIFLPDAGNGLGADLDLTSSDGGYWSSSPCYNTSWAYRLYLNFWSCYTNNANRFDGRPVRPVRIGDAQNSMLGVSTSLMIDSREYELEINEYGVLTGYKGVLPAELILPDGINRIEAWTFEGCASLESVIIPEGVREIGYGAFDGCLTLSSISVPDSVVLIERGAFAGTPFYENQQSRLVVIGSVFYGIKAGCPCPDSITIPEGVATIGYNAFYDCGSLESITLPGSLKTICSRAFEGCRGLQSVVIPDGVTTIEYEAFACCVSLQSIVIPSSVSTIGEDAFAWRDSPLIVYTDQGDVERVRSLVAETGADLSQFVFIEREGEHPSDPVDDGEGDKIVWETVENSDGTLSITGTSELPEDFVVPSVIGGKLVTAIASGAFSGKSLNSVVVPEGVVSIASGAFSYQKPVEGDVSRLKRIELPSTLERLGGYSGCEYYYDSERSAVNPFDGCAEGCEFVFPKGNSNFAVVDGQLVRLSDGTLVSGTVRDGAATIPACVTAIGTEAFYNQNTLKAVTIPKTCKVICINAFWASALEQVHMDDGGVEIIWGGAFQGCSSLSKIDLPDGLSQIWGYIAKGSSVQKLEIPASVELISAPFYGMGGLKEVVFLGDAPEEKYPDSTFRDVPASAVVKVKRGTRGWDMDPLSYELPASGYWPYNNTYGRRVEFYGDAPKSWSTDWWTPLSIYGRQSQWFGGECGMCRSATWKETNSNNNAHHEEVEFATQDATQVVLEAKVISVDSDKDLPVPDYTIKVHVDGTQVKSYGGYSKKWYRFEIPMSGTGYHVINVDFVISNNALNRAAVACCLQNVKVLKATPDVWSDVEVNEDSDMYAGEVLGDDHVLAKADLYELKTWANRRYEFSDIQANSNGMFAFDAQGNPTSKAAEAFLLNCDVDKINEAKEKFKILGITFAEDGLPVFEVDDDSYNGELVFQGSNDMQSWSDLAVRCGDDEEHPASEGYKFFRVQIRLLPPLMTP